MTGLIWGVLSSLRTTAVLAMAMALWTGVAAFVPQGSRALEQLQIHGSPALRGLAAWGLTDVFGSPWLRVLAVLLAGNVLTVILRAILERSRADVAGLDPPRHAPHQVELKAPLPERAVESLRETFRAVLGTSPLREEVSGSRVTMVFMTSPVARFAPLLLHLGLILMVVGAGLASRPPPAARQIVRALLEVTDSQSGAVGIFDLAQNESVQFFQWQARWTIRDYLPSRGNLGPAIRIETVEPDGRPAGDFWVYLHAPKGFDQRHRRGVIAIEAKRMGLAPVPGAGMASSPAMVLVLFGLGLLGLGAYFGQRPEGVLFVEADGEDVRVTGLPAVADDAAFGTSFDRYALLAKSAVEP